MPLSAFTVQNYRSFLERTHIELRPLTLLFGRNNVGKSALCRVVPLIAESLAQRNGPIAAESPALRGGKFTDIVSRLGATPTVEFELFWNDESVAVTQLRIVIREVQTLHRRPVVLIEKLEARDASGQELLLLDWVTELESDQDAARLYLVRAANQQVHARISFAGLSPTVGKDFVSAFQTKVQANKTLKLLSQVTQRLQPLVGLVSWLGSVREPPKRDDEEASTISERLSSDGRETLQLLSRHRRAGGEMLREISAWYERVFRWKLDLEDIANTERFRAILTPVDNPLSGINLADTGEGISQVLPVLLYAALARRAPAGISPLVTMEQPELHLHDDAQIGLATHLCAIAASTNPPLFLIETHSESVLLGVQLAVLQKQLPPDRVRMYWVKQDSSGQSYVEPVAIDELGRLSGLPPGAFMESTEQAREIYRLRQANRKA